MPVYSPSVRRYLHRLLLSFLIFFGLALAASAEKIQDISPSGFVTDLAGVIRADTKARLETLCTEVQQKTGAQIAVVTVHSLEGETVEEYAVDLFKHLGVGGKKESNGVLLLVAPDEHKYRIEMGYGLEPTITDARAGDAGRAMVPLLREGNYSAAIELATWQLAKYIGDANNVTFSGQPPAGPVRIHTRGGDDVGPGIWAVLSIFFLIFLVLTRAIPSLAGRGSGSGCLWAVLSILVSGGGGRGGWGGSSGGGFGGGGFGGGGGGFGGFGGGSSGGGGASGSW